VNAALLPLDWLVEAWPPEAWLPVDGSFAG
jgi:hypothetical protein